MYRISFLDYLLCTAFEKYGTIGLEEERTERNVFLELNVGYFKMNIVMYSMYFRIANYSFIMDFETNLIVNSS